MRAYILSDPILPPPTQPSAAMFASSAYEPPAVASASSAYHLPCHALSIHPPPHRRRRRRRRDRRPPVTRAACGPGAACHRVPTSWTHGPHPYLPHPLLSDAGGCFLPEVRERYWVPTSRCRARLTPRSPPTRTRRALFGRHAAADGLRGESYRASPALCA